MKLQNFKYEGSGLQRFFGPLETRILEAIWEAQEPSTIKEVQDKLGRDKPMSFNTVMTVMNRLVDKGVLLKSSAARSYRYRAVMSKEEFLETQSKELTLDLVQEFGPLAVAHMVDAVEQVDPQLLDELERKIQQIKKDR